MKEGLLYMVIYEKGIDNKSHIVIIHDDHYRNWDESENINLWSQKYHIVIIIPDKCENKLDIEYAIQKRCGKKIFAICSFDAEYQLTRKILRNPLFTYENLIVESKNCVPGKLVKEFIALNCSS